MRHLISLHGLTRQNYLTLFELAELAEKNKLVPKPDCHCVTLFFEPSTRTLMSFEMAANNLGIHHLRFDVTTSSFNKAESYEDTLQTLGAMRFDTFIIRHGQEGALETAKNILTQQRVISAGEGCREHPTQALLDLFTLYRLGVDFPTLKIAIVGDVVHSRVASSLIIGLQALGVLDIRLVGPEHWLPDTLTTQWVQSSTDLNRSLSDVDIIYVLRVQNERLDQTDMLDTAVYHQQYGLTKERLNFASPKAFIMHPGPVNRGIEIASDLVNHPRSLILQQVTHGVWMRMAVLSFLEANK